MALLKQDKQTTAALLTAVAALWGIIFYRLHATTTDKEIPHLPVQAKKTTYFEMIDHAKDTVTLDLKYPDPFEHQDHKTEPISESLSSPDVASIPPAPKPQVNWTNITYTGYINNQKNKTKLAMMTVNGKMLTLAEGQEANGVQLLKYTNDSVKLKYQNQTKYIRLK